MNYNITSSGAAMRRAVGSALGISLLCAGCSDGSGDGGSRDFGEPGYVEAERAVHTGGMLDALRSDYRLVWGCQGFEVEVQRDDGASFPDDPNRVRYRFSIRIRDDLVLPPEAGTSTPGWLAFWSDSMIYRLDSMDYMQEHDLVAWSGGPIDLGVDGVGHGSVVWRSQVPSAPLPATGSGADFVPMAEVDFLIFDDQGRTAQLRWLITDGSNKVWRPSHCQTEPDEFELP